MLTGAVFGEYEFGRKEMDQLSVGIIVIIVVCSFLFEYIDATLGMGYGTTLTPVFLLMGFDPLEIVPAILLSQLICGLLAGICHHCEGNVDFKLKATEDLQIRNALDPLGYIESVKRSLPRHLKVALLLAACGVFGTVAAVFVAVSIPKFWLKLYIGSLVLSIGVALLICFNKEFKFSWKRISILGLVASFNKGMSGGGYGPVVTGGQLLSGLEGKNAVGITALAEGLTCVVGVIMYVALSRESINWRIAPYIIAGAVLSVPLSAKSVKIINTRILKLAIALLTISLGTFTIAKTLLSG